MTSSSPSSNRADSTRGRGRAFLRFLVVGLLNTAASYAIFIALDQVLPYFAAYSLAFAAGIVSSYYLNTRVVFGVKRSWSTALRFPLVYLVQYLLGSAIVVALVEVFGVSAMLAALVAIVATVPVTFVAARIALRANVDWIDRK